MVNDNYFKEIEKIQKLEHSLEDLKKELNDKNQQMKDVVEAYESLFDKMKSSQNIEHLDSSLEDQEESKNSLEDTKDDSETATNENDNVLSKTRIPNSFSEFKSEFHGVSLELKSLTSRAVSSKIQRAPLSEGTVSCNFRVG